MKLNEARQVLGIQRRWICHILAAACALFIAVPIGYMAADREPPFRLTNGRVVPSDIPFDGQYTIEWTLVLNRRCESHVWQVIYTNVNPLERFTTVSVSLKQPSLFGEAPLTLRVPHNITGRRRDAPPNIPLGPIVIETWQEAYCNILQKIFDWPIVWKQPDVYATIVSKPK